VSTSAPVGDEPEFRGHLGVAGRKVRTDVAVQREVAEETGLQVELTGVAGAFQIETIEIRVAVLCLEARVCGGEVRLSEEHDHSAWVALAEMSKWNLTPGLREFAVEYAVKKAADS
jgi:8-oxo-dGTP pyrophosphatase MutT (NUDIX family)